MNAAVQRSMAFERLDQLAMEHLLGVRRALHPPIEPVRPRPEPYRDL
ncbi:hypothetical protein ACFQ7F_10340 [Streptomyces sp. NPDC056486]